jgi:hypothetical protein
MRNGDLSNEAPKRLLVNTDVFTLTTTHITKKFKILPKVTHHIQFDKLILNKLYMLGMNSGITLEMFSYELKQSDIDLLHLELDRLATNPFRYATAYKNSKAVVDDLPFRPEILGVVDIPSRKLLYGHWSYDIR